MDNVFKAMGVRLMQRVDAKVAELVPRQAFVTRSEGSHVFVRFAHEGADSPESRFLSTVAGVPAGTMGWVSTLGGKKGLFVATSIAIPFSKSAGAYQTITRTTAGESYMTNAELVLDGLIPNKAYDITLSIVVKVQGGGSGRIGWGWNTGGSWAWGGSDTFSFPSAGDLRSMTLAAGRTADSNGEIRLVPGIRWVSGTVTVTWGYITAQVNS